MRPRNALAFSISLILAAAVLAQRSGEAQANKAPKAGPGQPVFMAAADLKWTDLDPNGARRKIGGAARSGFLHDAARRELPAHDLLRQGLGMRVLCRKQRKVRSQAGGGGKGTREEVAVGRFVRSVKEECLDRLIPLGERHLRRALAEFLVHYQRERNHQALSNDLIDGVGRQQHVGRVRRRQRVGGLLSYYYRAA
jgi:hypothetical protein